MKIKINFDINDIEKTIKSSELLLEQNPNMSVYLTSQALEMALKLLIKEKLNIEFKSHNPSAVAMDLNIFNHKELKIIKLVESLNIDSRYYNSLYYPEDAQKVLGWVKNLINIIKLEMEL